MAQLRDNAGMAGVVIIAPTNEVGREGGWADGGGEGTTPSKDVQPHSARARASRAPSGFGTAPCARRLRRAPDASPLKYVRTPSPSAPPQAIAAYTKGMSMGMDDMATRKAQAQRIVGYHVSLGWGEGSSRQ